MNVATAHTANKVVSASPADDGDHGSGLRGLLAGDAAGHIRRHGRRRDWQPIPTGI